MRMDSEGILHFSFFFYVLMKGRIATISFGCLWINKFKKGGTHMKETKIYADEFCTTFTSTTEMLEFLAERAKQSKWIRKPTRMLKLVPLEKEAETIEEACEKELEGIVEDTEKNTQLVLKVNKDFYPVRDCAIHTILKRAGINGTGLKKLEKATYAKVVNYCLQVAKGDALIKVADGKVSAVHGGDDHDYCVLDMQTIFNMTSDYLKAHFKAEMEGFTLYTKPFHRWIYCGLYADSQFTVTPNGELYKCWEHAGDEQHLMGNINENGNIDNIKYSYYDWMSHNPLENEECKECVYLPACGGGCGVVSYNETNSYHSKGCFKVKGVLEKQVLRYFKGKI